MRIPATTLESFRLFLSEDWMTEERFLQGITRPFVPTRAMALGKAFGRVLERPERYQVPHGYRCDGFDFSDDVMAPALAVFDRRGVFEAKAVKAYGAHTVVAKADQLLGARLIENKTTDYFDFGKYESSYQWRFMADIFEPASITYHVFCLEDSPNNVIGLKGVESFRLYPYTALETDCRVLLREFVQYVTAKGLTGHFERVEAGVEAA